MKTKHILTALATASLIVGGQALAQGRGGGHGGGQGGGHGGGQGGGHGAGGVGAGSMGSARGGGGAGTVIDRDLVNTGVDRRTEARANSRAREHAADRAFEVSNENSVLHDADVVAPDLSGLVTGLTVRNSNGVTIGTVRRIVRSNDGTIRSVLVTGADGQRRTIQLRPGTLSVSGDIVTTTDVRVDDDD